MTIATLPPVPARTDAADVFVSRADSFLAALPTLQTDLNTLAANANAMVGAMTAGAVIAIPYTFSATVDGDPGSGGLRFNHATYASATAINISPTSATPSDVAAIIDSFPVGSNTIKGYVRVQDVSTPATYAIYTLTAVATVGAYRVLTVAYVAGTGTLSGSVTLTYTRAGDVGSFSQALGNTTITGIKGLDYNSEISNAPSAGAAAINWANGHQQKITSAALTSVTFSSPGASPCRLQLHLLAYSSPSSISWPVAVKWLTSSFTTPTANKDTLIDLYWDGTYYWSHAKVQV